MLGFLLMIAIIITSLPTLRRTSYNSFYYVHLVCSFWAFVALSIHTSTVFYFLLPELVLWIVDWGWRLHSSSRYIHNASVNGQGRPP